MIAATRTSPAGDCQRRRARTGPVRTNPYNAPSVGRPRAAYARAPNALAPSDNPGDNALLARQDCLARTAGLVYTGFQGGDTFKESVEPLTADVHPLHASRTAGARSPWVESPVGWRRWATEWAPTMGPAASRPNLPFNRNPKRWSTATNCGQPRTHQPANDLFSGRKCGAPGRTRTCLRLTAPTLVLGPTTGRPLTRASSVSEECLTDPVGGIPLHGGSDVAVEVHEERRVGMPEALRRDLRRHAVVKHQRGAAVA